MENSGALPFELQKGIDGTGITITINPGEKWKILSGYYHFTVTNSSLDGAGEITFMSY